jgi:Ca2+-binding RTX toxin-like protein
VLNSFVDSGANNNDRVSNDNSFSLGLAGNGTGTITYQRSTDGGTNWVNTTSGQNGLADGNYQFQATVTDTAGNKSTTGAVSVTIDRTAPTAPIVADYTASGIVGTAAAGTTTVRLATSATATAAATATVDAAGQYLLPTSNLPTPTAATTYYAYAGDLAGNTSAASSQRVVIGTTNNDTLVGGNGNDILLGGDGNDRLTGGIGKDVLVGGAGNDTFAYGSGQSPLANYDRITDLQIGTDAIDGPNTVTATNVFKGGNVAGLDQASISNVLTTTTFGVNRAATFTFGTQTFLALNNNQAGFNETTDSVIEITGYTGDLNSLSII